MADDGRAYQKFVVQTGAKNFGRCNDAGCVLFAAPTKTIQQAVAESMVGGDAAGGACIAASGSLLAWCRQKGSTEAMTRLGTGGVAERVGQSGRWMRRSGPLPGAGSVLWTSGCAGAACPGESRGGRPARGAFQTAATPKAS